MFQNLFCFPRSQESQFLPTSNVFMGFLEPATLYFNSRTKRAPVKSSSRLILAVVRWKVFWWRSHHCHARAPRSSFSVWSLGNLKRSFYPKRALGVRKCCLDFISERNCWVIRSSWWALEIVGQCHLGWYWKWDWKTYQKHGLYCPTGYWLLPRGQGNPSK